MDRWDADQVEDVLVHRVEEPSEGGDGEDSPAVAIDAVPPAAGGGGGNVGIGHSEVQRIERQDAKSAKEERQEEIKVEILDA